MNGTQDGLESGGNGLQSFYGCYWRKCRALKSEIGSNIKLI